MFLATMTLALMARFSASNYIPQGFEVLNHDALNEISANNLELCFKLVGVYCHYKVQPVMWA